MKKLILGGILIVFLLFLLSSKSYASLSSCSATVSPTTVNTVTSQSYTFTMGSVSGVLWIKITRPSSNFTITGASGSGWNASTSDSTATFTPVGQSAGSGTITLTATSGSSEASSANWTVQASDDSSGASPTTCSGSLGTAISGTGSDTSAPEISSITVSEVSTSSVKITWTTNESSNSVVQYGTSDAYGSSKSDSSSVTSHSLTISDLTHNTTYHFIVQSTDSSSNTGETSDETFATAQLGAATPTPKTVTVSAADSTTPSINLNFLSGTAFRSASKITGTAVDDKGISSLDYSLDNGKSWRKINSIKNLNSASTDFDFTPSVSADGVYTLKVRAKDAAGNTGTTKALKLIIDTTGPDISVTTDLSKPFAKPPKILGSAEDQSGEAAVEYAVDEKKNWQKVDLSEFSEPDTTIFEFSPIIKDDGNYIIFLRGKDSLGNIGEIYSIELIIDTLPPKIGGAMFLVGSQPLSQNQSAELVSSPTIEQKLVVSVVGGPTVVEVLINRPEDGKTIFRKKLQKSKEKNIWMTQFTPRFSGSYAVRIFAEDGAKQQADKDISKLKLVPEGKITDFDGRAVRQALVSLYVFDEVGKQFILWDGAAYGEKNPQKTDANGRYTFFIPKGKYYLEIKKHGNRSLRTNIFSVDKSTPLASDFILEPGKKIQFGPLSFLLPQVFYSPAYISADFVLNTERNIGTSDTLPDLKESPDILKQFRGKPTLLTFINTWWPQANSQINLLERLSGRDDFQVVVVVAQEPESYIGLYKKRGRYSINFLADPNGLMAESFGYSFIPTHFVLSRSLKIEKKIVGFLTVDQLSNIMIE